MDEFNLFFSESASLDESPLLRAAVDSAPVRTPVRIVVLAVRRRLIPQYQPVFYVNHVRGNPRLTTGPPMRISA